MARIRWFLFLLAVGTIISSYCMAADTDVVAEIEQTLKSHSQAFNNKDIDTVMSFYGPGAVVIGSGPGERYDGLEEIREAHHHFFASYDQETSEFTWHKIWVNGDVAWVLAMEQFATYFKNVKNEFPVNLSIVLEKQNGKWVFVSLHFSNLVCK